MNPIRRTASMVVLLGALAGCSEEDTTAPANSPATPSPSMAPKAPVVPSASATKGEPAKGGMSAEMQPAPAKAGEADKHDEARKPDEPKKGEGPPKVEGPKSEPSGKGDTAAAKLTPDEVANINQLPAADRDLALKQAVCPVSDEHLGEMGKPYKVAIEGRTVFLCCEECEKEVKADPKKVLAKVDTRAGKK